MPGDRWGALAAFLACIAFTSIALTGRARADEIRRGTVVKIEAGEIYFDIGRATGISAGAPVRFKHPIKLKHPVTGAEVNDELPLGELTVDAVGDILSMSTPEAGEGVFPVSVGDVVEVYVVKDVPKRTTPKPVPPKPTPPKPAPPKPAKPAEPVAPLPKLDPAAEKVLVTWHQTTGRPVSERIERWEAFLAENADTPYRPLIEEDLVELKELRDKLGKLETKAAANEPQVGGVFHASRTRTAYREPLPLSFAAESPDAVRAAWLHFRKRGSETFRKAELRRDGDAYLRGEIPAEIVADPGVEYFVEVATSAGLVGSAIGTPDQPVFVNVDAPRTTEIFRDTKARSRIAMRATFLDYSTFDDRTGEYTDTFLLFEADFLYRLYTKIYGVRVGFGSLNGKGGQVDPDPIVGAPVSGFNYAYWEMEVHTAYSLAFIGRLVAGLGEDGLGFGVEGRVRLGPETETNLTFAASTLEDIGFLSELHLQWAAFKVLPLGFGVALTNQPLGSDGDLGVRFSADVGIRALDWFQPTLRVSYQGRTVQHSGIGGGVGLVFDW